MGRPMTILVAVLIWIVAMIIAIPEFVFRRTFLPEETEQAGTHCMTDWPDGAVGASFRF